MNKFFYFLLSSMLLCIQHFSNLNFSEVIKNFDGEIWGKNGPQLLTRTIENLCNISGFKSIKKCENFTILERDRCYAISWEDWQMFFQPHKLGYVQKHTKNSYFVHLWNHFSSERHALKNSSIPLNKFAEKYCPRSYNSFDKIY